MLKRFLLALTAAVVALAAGTRTEAAAPAPKVIVIVHGAYSPSMTQEAWDSQFGSLQSFFESKGYVVFGPIMGNDNYQNAFFLADYIQETVLPQTHARKVSLVAHSMGGDSARYCIRFVLGCSGLVSSYLSIDTPQYGLSLACTALFGNSINFYQMCPVSGFILGLNAGGDTPGQIFWAQAINSDASLEFQRKLDGDNVCAIDIQGDHFAILSDPALQPKYLAAVQGLCTP